MNPVRGHRYIIFDLVKFLLSILVVNLHVESFVTGRPYSLAYYLGWIAVPMFVTISFYFNSSKYVSDNFDITKIKKVIMRLMLPFFFWSIFSFLLNPELITPKLLMRQITMGTAVDAPLYYLLIIMWYSLFFSVLIKLFPRYFKKINYIIILLSLSYEITGIKELITPLLPIQIEFFFSRSTELIKFASLGILMPDILTLTSVKLRKNIFLIATPAIFFWALLMTLTQPTHFDYSGIFMFLSTTFIFFGINVYKSISLKGFWHQLVASISIYSLGIYCLHSLVLNIANQSISPVLNTILITTTCLVLLKLSDIFSRGVLKPVII